MQVQKTNRMVEYDVTSRLIVGGRVYLPKHSITLDEAEGQVLCIRGYIKPKKITKETIRAKDIGVVTKNEATPAPTQPTPVPVEAPVPVTPAPTTPPVTEPAKEASYGKFSCRKNR